MNYIVIGGSNSLQIGGWVDTLAAGYAGGTVHNLSIGASPSMMGYYRLREFDQWKPGDTVLWEYALNDERQVRLRSAAVQDLLTFVKLTLALCAERGLAFGAILLRSQSIVLAQIPSDYRQTLKRFLSEIGVPAFDMEERILAGDSNRPPGTVAGLFRDDLHINPESHLPGDIADWVLKQDFPQPAQLALPDPAHLPNIALCDQFTGQKAVARLSNRLVNVVATHPARPDGRIGLRALPSGRFVLVGLVVLRTMVSGRLLCRTSTGSVRVPLQHPPNLFGKPYVLFTLTKTTAHPPLILSNDDPLWIRWHSAPPPDVSGDAAGGVVAAMLEEV